MRGGLALFWCDQIFVDVQEVTERYIDVHIRLSPNDPLWRLTCVYGEPRTENRHLMWSKMRELRRRLLSTTGVWLTWEVEISVV
jgi:hypothetical protein